jgi:hypothetical protein
MNWFLLIGIALTAWTLLLVLSGERQRRLMEIEAKRQQALAEMLKAQKQQEKSAHIPTIG